MCLHTTLTLSKEDKDFTKDEIVKKIIIGLRNNIQAHESNVECLGLLARIAAKKRNETKTRCTCKQKEDVKAFERYIGTKFLTRHHVGWLLNRLKDARHDLQRQWVANFGKINHCYCINFILEEVLFLPDIT